MKKHTDLLGFEILDENVVRKQIRQVIKEAACRQKSQELADSYSVEELQDRLDQIYRDMEQEAEPEGGPIADMYADEIEAYEGAIKIAKGDSGKGDVPYDVAIGRMTQDEYDKYMSTVAKDKATFTKSSKFDRMNETTEKAWNAVDVSRKAEKAISNKEWNERTSKKLDMLKKLNDAGKFKKDFDDERLQGWVDQNYSWEKLSKQFKLNEMYSEMYEQNTRSGEFNVNVPVQNEMEKVNIKYGHVTGPLDDVTISWGDEVHNVDFEEDDVVDDHGNEGKDMIFVAYSEDDKWRFTVDVSVGFNYENSGEIQEVYWDTLEIDTANAKIGGVREQDVAGMEDSNVDLPDPTKLFNNIKNL